MAEPARNPIFNEQGKVTAEWTPKEEQPEQRTLQDSINATVVRAITEELQEAEDKAWDALGRYKFQMFGYWAAIWVHLNRIGGFHHPNPWKELVKTAKDRR